MVKRPRDPERRPLTREERLERKLEDCRARRDQWQRRYRFMVDRCHALERRRSWVERYVGFRVEYRLRGWARRWRRYRRIMARALRGSS